MGRSLAFPFQIGDLGVPRTAARDAVIRQQLEQLLFVLPGERVNRPDFGIGVQRLVFAGTGPETLAAVEYVAAAGIRNFLADLIRLDAIKVWVDESTLYVELLYTVVETEEPRADTFTRPLEVVP
jgi:phage baseplate assembly protein W